MIRNLKDFFPIWSLQFSVPNKFILCNAGYSSLISEANSSSMFWIVVSLPESTRKFVRNAWSTVLKAREKHNQAKNREHSDVARGNVDTDTPRMTAQTLVNELVSVLYTCHSDMQLYGPTSFVAMDAITIDIIRTNHSSTDSILKMLLHLGNLIEDQRIFTMWW